MNIGLYGILIVFGLFVVLLIVNPNLSCFGKKIRSPFYPLLRKKKSRKLEAEDYGFDLGGKSKQKRNTKKIKTEDYGFDLGGDKNQRRGDKEPVDQ